MSYNWSEIYHNTEKLPTKLSKFRLKGNFMNKNPYKTSLKLKISYLYLNDLNDCKESFCLYKILAIHVKIMLG